LQESGVIIILEIFTYDFMRRAFIVAAVIGIIAPCIGAPIVLKRLSAIGDATSHSALAGIAAGLVFGINPILGAVVFSVFAVLGIELLRKAFGKYSEIATVVVMSAGIGLTAVLSGFVSNGSANLNSFLFGSIVAISDFEMYLTIGLGAVVIIVSFLLYRELFFVTFDEESAKLAGVNTGAVNLVLMLLTAVTVSVASRIVGALMISSLLVIPVAAAMTVAKSYKQTVWLSVVFAELFTISGLFISYYLDLRPGGTIVLLGVAILIILTIVLRGRRR
jgi:zinc transport system permease protein